MLKNNQCKGNDRWRGFYAAEWSSLSEETEFVLSEDEYGD